MTTINTRKLSTDGVDALMQLPFVEKITSNSFYMAIVIVLIITLMASFIFYESDDLFYRCVRLFFWGFISVSCLMLLKDSAEDYRIRQMQKDELTSEVFDTERPPDSVIVPLRPEQTPSLVSPAATVAPSATQTTTRV